jgi:ribosomal protein L20
MTPKLLERALKTAGGLEEFQHRTSQYSDDVAYIEKNKEELLKQYNDNWVAVFNSNIVAYGKNFKGFIKSIKKAGVPLDKVTVEYISRRKELTLF